MSNRGLSIIIFQFSFGCGAVCSLRKLGLMSNRYLLAKLVMASLREQTLVTCSYGRGSRVNYLQC